VKPRITLDFLRGLLAAYVARECYMYALVVPSVLREHSNDIWAAVIAVPLVIGAHLFVFGALLAGRSAKAVFVCLLLLAMVPFLSFVPTTPASFFRADGPHFTVRRMIFLIVHAASVIVAYVYYRGVCHAQRPNQPMQPTAGPRTASLSDD
jgi:uncharacterized membrane protein